MARVNCPECGRENVSDSAASCPGCGYDIKAHFDRIKQEEENKHTLERRMKRIQMPEKPVWKLGGGGWFLLILGGILALVGLIGLIWGKGGVFVFFIFGGIVIIFLIVRDRSSQYYDELANYNAAMRDFVQ